MLAIFVMHIRTFAHSHISNVYCWFFIFILLLIFEMLMGKLRFKKSKRKGC